MSAIDAAMEVIKARLDSFVLQGATEPALDGVDVFIDRQLDAVARVTKGIAGAKGCAISILYEGYTPIDGSSLGVRASFTVQSWSKPVLEKLKAPEDQLFADDLSAIIHKALHHWSVPFGSQTMPNAIGEMVVTDNDIVPDPRRLIYATGVTVPVYL